MRAETCGHRGAEVLLHGIAHCRVCYLEALEREGHAVPWEHILQMIVHGQEAEHARE